MRAPLSPSPGVTKSVTTDGEKPERDQSSSSKPISSETISTPEKTMDEPLSSIAREVLEEFITPTTSQIPPPCYSGQLMAPDPALPGIGASTLIHQVEESFDTTPMEFQEVSRGITIDPSLTDVGHPNLSITKQEVLALTNVLSLIPHCFLTGEEPNPNQALSVTVVDDLAQPPVLTTSSQEETAMPSTSGGISRQILASGPSFHGKRRLPRYSLTLGMLKKPPILKFSATGPLDAEVNPYKWWCRVCTTELSLMSRGSLELLSHYRSDSHLIKEHRIRMEIPGTTLYDKEGRELLGIALQEAKKTARETHPFAPPLDRCRPLVGQATVPEPNAVTSPTEKVLFQISIIEDLLRHGGHITSLIGVYEGLSQLSSCNQLSTQDWSDQRLFVSISYSLLLNKLQWLRFRFYRMSSICNQLNFP